MKPRFLRQNLVFSLTFLKKNDHTSTNILTSKSGFEENYRSAGLQKFPLQCKSWVSVFVFWWIPYFSLIFLLFLSSLNAGQLQSRELGRGPGREKIWQRLNIQASTRVLTKDKPEMVSIFYYLPKSRKVRFKWMQKQKFLFFFSVYQLLW